MTSATVARSYAESVFELAQTHNLHDEFTRGFAVLNAVLAEQIVRAFLISPRIDTPAKKRVLRDTLRKLHPLFLNFLMVVLDKRRQRILAEIGREYHALVDEAQGRIHVQVTVAREPSAGLHKDIRGRLSEVFGKTVVPHVNIDPRIIGGIVVRHEDTVIDGSLRRRLLALRRRLMEAHV